MKFKWQNYNEFKSGVSWHDYVSVIVNEFPVLLVRRYDWLEEEMTTWLVQILGFQLMCKCVKWKPSNWSTKAEAGDVI